MRLPVVTLKSNPCPQSRFRLLAIRLAAATLLTAVITPTISFGQEPTQDDDVIRVSTDLLLFPIRVRDKRNTRQKLTEADLTLKDEDRVTSGMYFSAGADRLALVFALDQSGSLREVIGQQRAAAMALFSRFGEQSRVAVMRFTERPVLVADFGRDFETIQDAFLSPAAPNQRTAIFNAAEAAVASFAALPRIRSERRIVILISDGLDNASSVKAERVINVARQNHVSFYVIHLPLFEPYEGRLTIRPTAKGFRDLAEKTGGKFFVAGDAKSALSPTLFDLTPVFKAIEDDLRGQYLVGFYLGENANDGRKHRFSLSLPGGVEYQVSGSDYSRKHEFFVDRPREALKRR